MPRRGSVEDVCSAGRDVVVDARALGSIKSGMCMTASKRGGSTCQQPREAGYDAPPDSVSVGELG